MECTWVFTRGDERLEVQRCEEDDGNPAMVVRHGSAPPRHYEFPDVRALMRFQSDMELFLLQTGWAFTEFLPERRTGRDRRGFPRLTERRRWWTDGLKIYRERGSQRGPTRRSS
jgi:hypothetical protein